MYWIAPSAGPENSFATWENGFSDSEIQRIIEQGEQRVPSKATVSGDQLIEDAIRKSKVAWIESSNETTWLYDRVAFIVRQLNSQFFHFDLTGFAEPFQYTIYTSSGDHYDWHIDKGVMNGSVPRKLSLVIQLTDPSEYEGGDLILKSAHEDTIVKKQKGLVVSFPSWVLHRVTPVTAGTRRTLVMWTGGPAFR